MHEGEGLDAGHSPNVRRAVVTANGRYRDKKPPVLETGGRPEKGPLSLCDANRYPSFYFFSHPRHSTFAEPQPFREASCVFEPCDVLKGVGDTIDTPQLLLRYQFDV